MCSVDNAPMLIIDAVKEIISTANKLYSIKVERDTAEYNNELMLQQAKKEEKEASEARQTGIEEARNKRIQSILQMGNDNAKAASNNIAVSSVNLLNINNDNKLNAELDALTTLKNSNKTAQKYEENADNVYAKYGLNKFSAYKQFKSGLFSIGDYANRQSLSLYKEATGKKKNNTNL